MQNPFNHELDNLFEAKHKCGLQNSVTFISSSGIAQYLNYMKLKFGKNWKKMFVV